MLKVMRQRTRDGTICLPWFTS